MAPLETTVKTENSHRHRRSTTIAANFHSLQTFRDYSDRHSRTCIYSFYVIEYPLWHDTDFGDHDGPSFHSELTTDLSRLATDLLGTVSLVFL